MGALNLRDGASHFNLSIFREVLRVEAESGWFRARLDVPFDASEMSAAARRLLALDAAGAGSYSFLPAANWGEIVFAMGKKGELHVSIRLQSEPDYLNEARLFLNLRQDALPKIAAVFTAMGEGPSTSLSPA